MSRRITAFPGKKAGIKAPSIKAPSSAPNTSSAPAASNATKPSWRVQREQEEQRKREEEARIKAEKQRKLQELRPVFNESISNDPILASIRGGYSSVEDLGVTDLKINDTASHNTSSHSSTPHANPPQANFSHSFDTQASHAPVGSLEEIDSDPVVLDEFDDIDLPVQTLTTTHYGESDDHHVHEPEPSHYSPPPPVSYNQPSAPSAPSYQKPSAPSYQKPTAPSYQKPTAPSYQKPTAPAHQTPSAPAHQTPSAPAHHTPSAPSVSGGGAVCDECHQALSGAVINAKGKQFHQHCFRCGGCGRVFGGGEVIYELEGKPHCATCKGAKSGTGAVGTHCSKCNKPITSAGVEALGTIFHPECFCCTRCQTPFTGSYVQYEGKPYCKKCADLQAELDAEKELGRCGGCGLPITFGKIVNVAGGNWHFACFKCTGCGKPFEREYFSYEDKPYCAACHPGH